MLNLYPNTKMLNVLENFMSSWAHILSFGDATGVEKRQSLTERFNRDSKVFAFILSTRSGGLGINLVGADTVIFYDTDWNPAMDAQAQDRAHRIGQTRDVHIYRLVTEHTVEENIIAKANQKRHLNMLSIEQVILQPNFFWLILWWAKSLRHERLVGRYRGNYTRRR